MVERLHDNLDDHIQNLQRQGDWTRKDKVMTKWNPFKELAMSEKFRIELEGHKSLAIGMFGKGIDPNNLTDEQNAKIQDVNRGFNRAVADFFKQRGIQEDDISSKPNT